MLTMIWPGLFVLDFEEPPCKSQWVVCVTSPNQKWLQLAGDSRSYSVIIKDFSAGGESLHVKPSALCGQLVIIYWLGVNIWKETSSALSSDRISLLNKTTTVDVFCKQMTWLSFFYRSFFP